MYIHVKVTAGAKKESFRKIKEDHFAVSVREKAESNMANKRVLKVLEKNFSSKVFLISGHRSPSKIFRIE